MKHLARWLGGWSRSRRTRRRPADAAPARGLLAWLQRPAAGRVYWLLVWLSAFLLLLPDHAAVPVRLAPGQCSPVTLVAARDVFLPVPAAPRGAARVAAGTVLVERGARVDAETAARVHAYQRQVRAEASLQDRLVGLVGKGIVLGLGLFVSAILFRFARPAPVHANSMILLFLIVSLSSLAPATWLLGWPFKRLPWLAPSVEWLMPHALAPLLMALLAGPMAALAVGFWASFAGAVLADGQFQVLAAGLTATAVVAGVARSARSRAALVRLGLWAGAAAAIGAIGFATLSRPGYAVMFQQALASLAAGIASALAAMLLLPLIELIFGISTDISLLELADLEHPLLKRLAIEAPGTYHHSLMVANLTQAAVAAIGGNALRAGICAYFHDIGKLVKPSFFSENTQFNENPHDDLSPSMSTLVIVSHVKEGVNLALRHKLPRAVMDAIQQHHGTGLVYYFFHKAATLSAQQPDEANAVKEADFRYPGPKPRSREIAVLGLADAVEAASRSMEKVTPGHVEDLVGDIVAAKLRDGQFDACDLTLSDVSAVRRVLVFTLLNMLHARIAYPAHEGARPELPDAPPG